MGATSSALTEETKEALRESFDLEGEGSTPDVSLVFNDRAVDELLAKIRKDKTKAPHRPEGVGTHRGQSFLG